MRYLEEHGFTILARNYRTSSGEVDIIAQQGELIAFVEVKTRQQIFFDVTEVITPVKQRRISSAARNFLSRHLYENAHNDFICRFDVAIFECHTNKSEVTYIENAFYGYE